MARAWGDQSFTQAADAAVAKIREVLPKRLNEVIEASRLTVARDRNPETGHAKTHLASLRRAIRERRRIEVTYLSLGEDKTIRILRPLGLAFFGPFWMLASRIERFERVKLTDQTFRDEPGKTIEDFVARGHDKPALRNADTKKAGPN